MSTLALTRTFNLDSAKYITYDYGGDVDIAHLIQAKSLLENNPPTLSVLLFWFELQ